MKGWLAINPCVCASDRRSKRDWCHEHEPDHGSREGSRDWEWKTANRHHVQICLTVPSTTRLFPVTLIMSNIRTRLGQTAASLSRLLHIHGSYVVSTRSVHRLKFLVLTATTHMEYHIEPPPPPPPPPNSANCNVCQCVAMFMCTIVNASWYRNNITSASCSEWQPPRMQVGICAS